MIQLQRKSTFNFYESFSDLIFCTLVLFLVLVLFLALNVNRRVEDVRAEEADVSERKEKIAKAGRRIDKILGTNRFAGHSGDPYILLAIQWDGSNLRFHPIPTWLALKLTTRLTDLTAAQRTSKDKALLTHWKKLCSETKPLSPEQMRQVFYSTSFCRRHDIPGIDPSRPYLGVSIDDDNRVYHLSPGFSAAKAGIAVGDTMLSIGGIQIQAGTNGLTKVLERFRVGQKTIVSVKRAGKMDVIDLEFLPVREVSLDTKWFNLLSFVVSGLKDTEGSRILDGKKVNQDLFTRWDSSTRFFIDAKWRELLWKDRKQDQWMTRLITDKICVLPFDVTADEKHIRIGKALFSRAQCRRVFQSLSGSIAVEYKPKTGPKDMPYWVQYEILVPSGFVNNSPDLSAIREEKQ